MVNSLTDRRKASYGDQLVATSSVFLYATRCIIPKQFANIIPKVLSDSRKIYGNYMYRESQNHYNYILLIVDSLANLKMSNSSLAKIENILLKGFL